MLLQEDIGKAYLSYYTHTQKTGSTRRGAIKAAYERVKRGYFQHRYNYSLNQPSGLTSLLGRLLYLTPIRRGHVDAEVRFLEAKPCGKLLDVGCGAGEWLLSMRERGWEVDGVDFDENAVKAAAKAGLRIRCGSLEQQAYADASFDAVTLNHVIEHVPDPLATLQECYRILKPGGHLVVCTPNASSMGHKVFKQHWRGLEPPRHLHIFNMKAMRAALARSEYQSILIHPHISAYVIEQSMLIRRRKGGVAVSGILSAFYTSVFNLIELLLVGAKPDVADCLAAVAIKR